MEPPLDLGIDGLEDAVLVGRGGYGSVYRARQPRLNREVAVKVLSTSLDDTARARFEREGLALGTVSGHPNIVQVLAVGTTAGGQPYLVMPYVARGALDHAPPLPWPEAIGYAVRLCGALESAHRAAVLHRDVKPANVLLSDYGEPLLADFGIARISGGFQTTSSRVNASLPFAAPEVLEGKPASAAADVYSLAATVHCLISGQPPLPPREGEEIVAYYVRISREPPDDLRPLGVPDPVAAVIEQGLAKKPGDRPGSAADFGRALQAAQAAGGGQVTGMSIVGGDAPAPAAPATGGATTTGLATVRATEVAEPSGTEPLDRNRSRVLLGGAAVLALALALLAFVLFAGDDPGDPAAEDPTTRPSRTASEPESQASEEEPTGSAPAAGGSEIDAGITRPRGLTVTADGRLLVVDDVSPQILAITPRGEVEVFAGSGEPGNSGDEGPAVDATLADVSGVAAGPDGDVYVVTAGAVRRVDADGVIHPVSGLTADAGIVRVAAYDDGTLAATDGHSVFLRSAAGDVRTLVADLTSVSALAVHPDGWLAVAETGNNQILRVDREGRARPLVGLGGDTADPRTDGFPALESAISEPTGLAFDSAGHLYFSEVGNSRVRTITDDGTVVTVAGSPAGFASGNSGDGGPGREATFALGAGALAFGPDGELYIGDENNGRVRRLDADGLVHPFVS